MIIPPQAIDSMILFNGSLEYLEYISDDGFMEIR
jgi:hypothetical protein